MARRLRLSRGDASDQAEHVVAGGPAAALMALLELVIETADLGGAMAGFGYIHGSALASLRTPTKPKSDES